MLIILDTDDRFVAYQEGAELAAVSPGGRLITTAGLGHHRILRDSGVIEDSVAFISGTTSPSPQQRRAS
jgi:hypothetical protein